jgi:AcrR family transcriptional regulator
VTAHSDIAPASTDLPPTPKGKATREKLLNAAEIVFSTRGYDQSRIADIVAEAGISHGLFYRHFTDKDAILNAVLDRLNDRLRDTSGRVPSDSRVPTLEQLQVRNIQFFREYAEHRLLLRVSREAAARSGASDGESLSSDDFRSKWLANRNRFVMRTYRWLEELAANGDIAPLEDPHSIAEGLSALTEQMAYVQVGLADADPDREALERLGKACGLIWYRTIFGPEETAP